MAMASLHAVLMRTVVVGEPNARVR